MYLLTEWEGRTEKYLTRGHDVRTERSEVRAPLPKSHFDFKIVILTLKYKSYFDRKVGIYIATKLF